MTSSLSVRDAPSAARALPAMVPVRYRVASRTAETADTVTLGLDPADAPIEAPTPGQFTMVYAFGAGEVPISVSRRPSEEGRLHLTVRAAGPTTRLITGLAVGETVGVRGPYGTAWPLDDAVGRDVVVVAGGIGLAPLRPVVHDVVGRRDEFDHVAVLIGARTPADLLFEDEVAQWRGRFDLDVELTVDAADASWRGDVGLVTALFGRLRHAPERAVAFVCGPEVMQRFVARALLLGGIAPERIHLSLERNMHCAVRHCGHCQLGPLFVCSEGPVVSWAVAAPLLEVRRW